MRSTIDQALEHHRNRDYKSPLPTFVFGILRRVVEKAHGESDPAAEAATEALLLMDDRTTRYWIARLDALAWSLAADPLSAESAAGCTPIDLPRRSFQLVSTVRRCTARIDDHRMASNGHDAELGAGPVSILLPVVAAREIDRGGIRIADLPIGTVILRQDSGRVVGRLGQAAIRGI